MARAAPPVRLAGILEAFRRLPRPVVLPLHPRTRKTLGAGLERLGGKLRPVAPVPYPDMLILEKNARIILTDSGGVQGKDAKRTVFRRQ